MKRFCSVTPLLALVICLLMNPGEAQAQKDHPAAPVAQGYLKAVALRDWDKAVTLVDAASLEHLKQDQIRYLKAAPTMKAEEALLGRLGAKSIGDIEKLPAKEVYLRRSKAQVIGSEPDAEVKKLLSQIGKSLKFRLLGVVKDSETLVHVLLRSTHERRESKIDAMDVVSVKKSGKSWKVSLDAQQPIITKAAK